MLNMTTLSGGVQIFASKPHFLDGHPWLVNQFKGAMKPREEIHQTYIDIEPFTGDPFRLAERLQVIYYKHHYIWFRFFFSYSSNLQTYVCECV
jgi:hypothetical protein